MSTQQPEENAGEMQPEPASGNGSGAESGAPAASPEEMLSRELDDLRQKLAEAQDRVLRIQADADNQRKRLARDVENAHKYGTERLLAEMIPVLDSLELGIAAIGAGPELENLRQGMDLTLKKFLDTLARFGVKPVDPQGEKFNPERHEAVSTQPQEGADPNTILTVLQKGYELNGRLVRPAIVVIAKG